jgi:hypothetical protein
MKRSEVKQIFQKLLMAVVIVSLICPWSLWAKKEKAGAKVIVTKEDGQQINGELLKVEENSLLLLIHESLTKVSINIKEIEKIWIKRKSKTGKGALIGSLSGGAAGYAIAYLSYLDTKPFLWKLGCIASGMVGALVGLFVGGTIGYYSPSSKEYQVKGKPPDGIKMIMKKLKKKARFKK